MLYDRAAVVAWLADNDLKTMVFRGADRKPPRDNENFKSQCADLSLLKIGIKPKKFSGSGKTKTVRVRAHDDYPEPRQHWQRGSHSADHRVLVSF